MNSIKQLIVVLGAGESGVGAAILAKKIGHEVFVSDNGPIKPKFVAELVSRNIDFEMNGHSIEKVMKADHVVKSPGIPDNVSIVKLLQDKGVPVISEIEFAFWYNTATIIGITGSNGKTTTTNLIHHLLVSGGVDAIKGGNLGKSFARLVAEENPEVFVLELSSFQLDGIRSFRPNIALLLNITPDHLDRYDYIFDNYVRSKFRITLNQTKTDLFIYNAGDRSIRTYLSENPIKARKLPVGLPRAETSKEVEPISIDIPFRNPALRGHHNRFNVACAIKIARFFHIDDDTIEQALNTFTNDPHRLEFITTINDVDYINDSKATNVDAAFYALEAMDRPIIWIAGGTDKGNEYEPLDELVKEKVKTLICLGADNEKLLAHFGDLVPNWIETTTAEQAAREAYRLADPGDVVLLSPACASFDLFENFMARGDLFREAVLKLKEK